MKSPSALLLMAIGLGSLFAPTSLAQVFDESFDHWPLDHRIGGTLVFGDASVDMTILSGIDALDAEARAALIVDDEPSEAFTNSFRRWVDGDTESEHSLELFEIDEALEDSLEVLTQEFDVLCWLTSEPVSLEIHERLTKAREPLDDFVQRGGVLIALGSIAPAFAQHAVTGEGSAAVEGLNLMPDCLIELDYSPQRREPLLSALAKHPRSVGIGIETGTAIMLRGRKIRAYGQGSATFMLMANERQPLRVQTISQRQSRREAAQRYLVDLTEWRREAIDRTLEPFPPAEPKVPHVDEGTLVIVGGGGLPDGLMPQFVDLAGGAEDAKLIYVPCSESPAQPNNPRMLRTWRRMGVQDVAVIHTKDRTQANEDEEFLAPLREATGIWFGGGRQWNFADSYYGTTAHRLMKEVLHRGGVIGGSSAGASIQARYLARATPIGNYRIMAPGYERGGLGFISGVAIDQHFSERGRQKDMTQLMSHHPQLLGIGIDEGTALIVTGSIGQVVGRGRVHFYDRNLPVYPDKPDYIALERGSRYDLASRKIVDDDA